MGDGAPGSGDVAAVGKVVLTGLLKREFGASAAAVAHGASAAAAVASAPDQGPLAAS